MSDGSIRIDVELNSSKAESEYDQFSDRVSSKKVKGPDIDTSDGKRQLKELSSEAQTAAKVGIAAIGATAIAFGGFALKSAGDLQAMESQFEQTFGNMQGKAEKVVNSMSKDFNMVPNRLKPVMSKMTSMFKGLGMDTETAMKKAEDATRMTADAAAFYDVSFESANESLTSFVKGNYEGGEAVGIFANDTQMATFAVKKGLIGATKEWANLDEATKQATRLEYAQNMQKLGGVTGQAAREANGFENVMGNLKQSVKDFAAAFGAPFLDGFLNMVSSASKKLSEFAEKLKENPALAYALAGAVTTLVAALSGVYIAANAAKWLGLLKAALFGTGTTIGLLANPIFWIIAAIGALVTAFIYLWKTNENFRKKVTEIWQAISDFLMPIIEEITTFIKTSWEALLAWWNENQDAIFAKISAMWTAISEFVSPIIQSIVDFIMVIWTTLSEWWNENQELIKTTVVTVWTAIKDFFTVTWEIIKAIFTVAMAFLGPYLELAWNNIKTVITTVWEVIKIVVETAMDIILNIIKLVTQIIAGDWDGAWNTIKDIASTAWNGIKDLARVIFDGIKELIANNWDSVQQTTSKVWGAISSLTSSIWNEIQSTISNLVDSAAQSIQDAWQNALSWTQDIFSSIKDTVMSIGDIDLFGAGQAIMQGFLNGLQSMWDSVTSFVGGIADWIAENKGPISYDRRLLIPAGKAIMNGFNDSLQKGFRYVQSTVKGVAPTIQKTIDAFSGDFGSPLDFMVNDFNFDEIKAKDTARKLADIMQSTVKAGLTNLNLDSAINASGSLLVGSANDVTKNSKAKRSIKTTKSDNDVLNVLSEQNAILKKILDKNQNVILDGKKVAEVVNENTALNDLYKFF
ncbi:hypothetical protein CBF34_07035 [Vagococcus penaei]|uniref:phage tail protein n=1 Tax=Vagococcus penaei TaxID=633807 RepID=UPI000F8840B6|nr:hypothetical protein [Vagococcus penaei]RSU01407.1 hypothetical protein CBF34_07035 [Vagococcus penaei]